MVSLYVEVRFIDMYAMAYITRIKKIFLPYARRSSNFIKRMEKLTKTKGKYLSDTKKKGSYPQRQQAMVRHDCGWRKDRGVSGDKTLLD